MNMTEHTGYLFEASWEVCNKVGGIYTVLASKAKNLKKVYGDGLIFIGPDIWHERESLWFQEDSTLLADWKACAAQQGLKIRIGRWQEEGKPIAVLVDFRHLFAKRNEIYAQMWDDFGVNSLNGYGDYDESSMFAYAAGQVVESYYRFFGLQEHKVIAHFDEWQLAMGLLYVKKHLPQVATVFTTHATSIGRSIAGNHKPLYNYLTAYNGDQMARELNMEAKHSAEKCAALNADCFTTVSDITARECAQLLERMPMVTPNGFEQDIVPKGKIYERKRAKARKTLINVAEKLLGQAVEDDALLVATSGRYEYKNKGIDVFIEALSRLRYVKQLPKTVVAFIMVPAWMKEPRPDLAERLRKRKLEEALHQPVITHWLHNMNEDAVLNHLQAVGMHNQPESPVKVIFVPSYLNGEDGIFNLSYYDLLIGMDITVFPSYYEPWGYTPHESMAFAVPTITTTLAGFGIWNKNMGDEKGLHDGMEVIPRDDSNFHEVAENIKDLLFEAAMKSEEEVKAMRKCAETRAKLADWSHFIEHYHVVYQEALKEASLRMQ